MKTVGEKQPSYSNYIMSGVLLLIIGLCLLTISLCLLGLQIKANSYVPTEAIVVDHHKTVFRDEGRTDISYWNIVEYTVDGKTYRAECDYAESSVLPDNLGEIIVVYINPDDPTDVIFKHSTHFVLIAFTAVIATGLFIGTTVLFIKGKKLKNHDGIIT